MVYSGYYRAMVLFAGVAIGLAGCGGSGSDDAAEVDPPTESDDPMEALTLSASSDIMQVHLSWGGADAVDILYSSDPGCDWDNYSLCSGAGMLSGVTDSEVAIGAVEENLSTERGWYFVVEADERRSSQVAARPAVPSFGGYQIYALETDGDNLYVGGSFSRVALATGGLAMFDAQQDNTLTGVLPYMEGQVLDIVDDGTGGWIVGGLFERVDGKERINLARLRQDGTVETDWQVDVNGPVYAMAVQGDRLFIGGDFSQLTIDKDAQYNRSNLAAIELSTGVPVTGWNPTINDPVWALTSNETQLYLGGSFTQVNGTNRNHLAALSIDDGSVNSGWTPSANDTVNTLLYDSGAVFAGGLFTRVSDDDRDFLVKIDAVSGGVDGQWNPGAPDEVLVLGLWEDQLLAGGVHSSSDWPTPFSIIDRTDGAHDQSWDLPDSYLSDDVHGLAVSGDRIYIATERNLMALDAPLKTSAPWEAKIGVAFDDGPRAIAATPDQVLVGGEFPESGGNRYNSIAVMDIETGVLQEPLSGSTGQVYELLYNDGRLYAGGTMYFNADQQSIAAFDLTTMARDEDWKATASSSRDVSGLAISGGTLYAGGRFGKVGDEDVVRVTGFDLVSGELSDFTHAPEPDDTVNALAATEDQLLLGGRFGNVAGQAHEHLVSLKTADGTMTTGWTMEASNTVNTFHWGNDTTLYVGGRFNTLGGESHNGIARLLMDDGSFDLDTGWTPAASNTLSIATGENRVFVGRSIAQDAADGLMAFSRFSNGSQVDDWDPAPDKSVNALLYHDGKLFVGGWFQKLDGKHRNLFGVLDADTGELIW